MKLLIDLQGAQGSSKKRGLGRFSLWFAKALIKQNKTHDIHIILNGQFQDSIDDIKKDFFGLLPEKNFHIFYPLPNIGFHFNNIEHRALSENIYEAFIETLSPNMLIIASFFEGYMDSCIFGIPQNKQYKVLTVLHDLIPLVLDKMYLSNENYKLFYIGCLKKFKNSDFFLSVSEASKSDAIKFAQIESDKIKTIYEASFANFEASEHNEKTQEINKKFSIKKPFLLSTLANDYRKNFEGLIEAFLTSKSVKSHQLVIVIKIEPSQNAYLKKTIKKYNAKNDSIVITGFVDDEELNTLYNSCSATIFPSHYEGFGLPVLESMQHGKAVICSNNSSLPEIINNEDALFDSHNIESIKEKIDKVLLDVNFRNRLEKLAIKQSKNFTWEKTAKKTLEFIEEINKNHPNKTKILPNTPKKKLAYVSPLPPEKTGIADYSAELLPALKKYYNIDVIIDQNHVSDKWIAKNHNMRSVDFFRKKHDDYDRILYHMGNSPFHIHMENLLKTIPGVVVLHDFYLSGINKYKEIVNGQTHYICQKVYENHGYKALKKAFNIHCIESKTNLFPCSKHIFKQSIGVIFHSKYSQKFAISFYNYNKKTTPIPLTRRPVTLKFDKEKAKKILGFPKNALILSSFGFVDESKMHHIIYQAFKQSSIKNHSNAYLIFAGGYGNPYSEKLKEQIKTDKLQEKVIFTNWLNKDEYENHLKATDIAIQLRKNSKGESSAALLDCLNYALPTIINANGAMSEIPNNIVKQLENDFEIDSFINTLEDLCAHKNQRLALGKQARKYVEEKITPDLCAKKYSEQIEYFYENENHPMVALNKLVTQNKTSKLFNAIPNLNKSLYKKDTIQTIFVDISTLVKQDLKTGIERTTRAILKELLELDICGYRIEPVYASKEKTFRYARKFTCHFMGIHNIEMEDDFIDFYEGDIFLLLDWSVETTIKHSNYLFELKNHGVKIVSFIYDILPLVKPHFFPENMHFFKEWIDVLIKISNQIICISDQVVRDMHQYIKNKDKHSLKFLSISSINLGSDIENSSPSKGLPNNIDSLMTSLNKGYTFLMVGTLEPRKGYNQTIEAFSKLWDDGLNVNLIIVGKTGWNKEISTLSLIRDHPKLNKNLFWLNGISDEFLEKIYDISTCLIAASEGEGYGLPIIEATKHNLPIIARDIPVFREVSQNNADFFEDKKEPKIISDKIISWIEKFKKNKHKRSDDIKLITWKESAQQLLNKII